MPSFACLCHHKNSPVMGHRQKRGNSEGTIANILCNLCKEHPITFCPLQCNQLPLPRVYSRAINSCFNSPLLINGTCDLAGISELLRGVPLHQGRAGLCASALNKASPDYSHPVIASSIVLYRRFIVCRLIQKCVVLVAVARVDSDAFWSQRAGRVEAA